jgi:hypothetical protein
MEKWELRASFPWLEVKIPQLDRLILEHTGVPFPILEIYDLNNLDEMRVNV